MILFWICEKRYLKWKIHVLGDGLDFLERVKSRGEKYDTRR
ncbi:hypothetical protein CNEO3_50032 [Clostridium neonatale]|uniref:Uncharacterized protein n=1 Tax=Clostridium neonatale TaxID=137838 RepID=A0AA86JI46_9CLOT|nr:hypothetical protein CNEO_41193 [Clostridium neonatale]CAI3649377.1 hypothetical protein CNEO3_20032 [Clostridium neonatale]CAI3663879.1 hypothetical protein CNEO3_30031 [Clostridium neonatale]CAI3695461.1 hypothetical protein CNEO3_50032 [Clostridium neonatale]CAI3728053.1 hypothetical protein CNEO3_90032 [Clostridium neonatale]